MRVDVRFGFVGGSLERRSQQQLTADTSRTVGPTHSPRTPRSSAPPRGRCAGSKASCSTLPDCWGVQRRGHARRTECSRAVPQRAARSRAGNTRCPPWPTPSTHSLSYGALHRPPPHQGVRRRGCHPSHPRLQSRARGCVCARPPRRRRPDRSHPPALTQFGTLPPHLADNEFIRAHYRPVSSPAAAARSLWALHNETGNIWTHALGFLLFAVLTCTLLSSAPAHLHLHSTHLTRLETALASAGRRAAAAEARALARAAVGAAAAEASLEKAATAAWHAAAAAGAQLSSWEHDAASRARHAAAALLGGRWPTPRWPALVFMFGALTCLGTSAVCHLFGCCAEHVATALWRADYGGIITLIVTSFVPPLVYGFECAPFWRDFYMWTTLSLGAAVFVIAMVPFFQAPRFRVARAVIFTALALWGVAPAGHGLLLHGHEPAMVTAFWHYAGMGALYLLGVTCFAARVPERWAPGKFDIWFHSHQLFHVFIVAAAAVHYRGVRVLLAWRDSAGGLCAA